MACPLPRPLCDYRHVIWDWNGTLLDDAWLCVEVLNRLLGEYRLPPLDIEAYRERFGFPVLGFYHDLGFDTTPASFEVVSTRFVQLYHERVRECRLHQRTREVLHSVRAAQRGQSVLSASRQDHLETAISRFGLRGFFTGLFGIDTIHAPGKLERGRTAVASLGLPRSDIVLVGDTLHDAEVAADLGIDCLLLTCGHHSPTRLRAHHPWVADALGDLLPAAASTKPPTTTQPTLSPLDAAAPCSCSRAP